MYEFSYSNYIVFHVHVEKEKSSQKKEKEKEYQEDLKTS